MIQSNKVYTFSTGSVKIANKKFSSIKNDYCLTFEKYSKIQEVNDDGSISRCGYDFITIKDIEDLPP